MDKQKKSSPALLLAVTMASVGGLLLSGCSTTPDESYKKSEMSKPLDYPPDLVAPVTNKRFSVPSPDAPPISTPIISPETVPVPHKRANERGGHSH